MAGRIWAAVLLSLAVSIFGCGPRQQAKGHNAQMTQEATWNHAEVQELCAVVSTDMAVLREALVANAAFEESLRKRGADASRMETENRRMRDRLVMDLKRIHGELRSLRDGVEEDSTRLRGELISHGPVD